VSAALRQRPFAASVAAQGPEKWQDCGGSRSDARKTSRSQRGRCFDEAAGVSHGTRSTAQRAEKKTDGRASLPSVQFREIEARKLVRNPLNYWWPRAELNHRHKDFQAAQINGVLLLIKLLQHTPRFESSGTKAGTSPTKPRRVTA